MRKLKVLLVSSKNSNKIFWRLKWNSNNKNQYIWGWICGTGKITWKERLITKQLRSLSIHLQQWPCHRYWGLQSIDSLQMKMKSISVLIYIYLIIAPSNVFFPFIRYLNYFFVVELTVVPLVISLNVLYLFR